MAKKQTFVVGSTNPVTQSRTDAQLNTAWNQFEVLKAGELDGVLNAMSAQTKIDSEEITNALDVYSITPDPNDNTQLKQLLTQMDNKIDQVVSGGEIIGSFWYGKTTSGFTVPAPTQVGQTYIDFTTLDHYISNDGSTWTLNGTLTLPALQDAIVLITSKFWDIVEQQDQYGGRAIWSHDLSQWIYYPTIINLAGYARTDMDNLTNVGQNIANWSSNVTNCITEIPQDIKLELNGGTLTLKAGSKLYVPNGFESDGVTLKFDVVTTSADKTLSASVAGTYMVCYDPVGDAFNIIIGIADCSSGSTWSASSVYALRYNTAENFVKFTSNTGSTWSNRLTLPLCVVSANSSGITTVNNTFNGFGYIGTATFVLPGVRGLIPNGRNADGTCKSIELSITDVKVHELAYNSETSHYCILRPNGLYGYGAKNIFVSDTKPVGTTDFYTNAFWYDVSNNYIWTTGDNGANWVIKTDSIFVGSLQKTSAPGNISSINPEQPFKAIDRSEVIDLLEMIYPVGGIYISGVNTTECPMRLVIPGSTWQLVATNRALWGGDGTNAGTTIAAGLPNVTSALQAARRGADTTQSGSMWWGGNASAKAGESGGNVSWSDQLYFSAQSSSSIYGSSNTVQPPAYRVNVWRRVS